MRRRDLVRRINVTAQARGLTPTYTEGGAHTKVSVDERQSVIPRHREINEITARAILKQLDPGRTEPAMKITAVVTRSGSWWAVTVPEVEGAFTQAKRLDQVPRMVTDAVALLTGVSPDDIEVDVRVEVPTNVQAHLTRAARLRAESARSNSQAAAEVRAAARDLVSRGLPLRDVGSLLGVSSQRAHQLVS